MTPKEKAEDLLYNSYENMMYDYIENTFARKELARQCALVAVDEILTVLYDLDITSAVEKYWEQVQQEIDNL